MISPADEEGCGGCCGGATTRDGGATTTGRGATGRDGGATTAGCRTPGGGATTQIDEGGVMAEALLADVREMRSWLPAESPPVYASVNI